jgi:hypothetical protein
VTYAELADVQRYLVHPLSDAEEARVAELLADATSLVEGATGQSWRAIERIRRLPAEKRRVLLLPGELLEATTVELCGGGTRMALAEGRDYYFLHAGSTAQDPPSEESETVGYPAYAIRRIAGEWPGVPYYLEIDGLWASGVDVPEDVRIATAIIVAHWCRALGIGAEASSEVRSESWDGYSVSYERTGSVGEIPEQAKRLLDRYSIMGVGGGGLYGLS